MAIYRTRGNREISQKAGNGVRYAPVISKYLPTDQMAACCAGDSAGMFPMYRINRMGPVSTGPLFVLRH